MKKFVPVFAAAIAVMMAAPAMAESNKTAARGMAEALKGGGGGNNSPLKDADALDLQGQGGVASFVSGKGTGGWGNEGSAILGNQVSNSGK
jgi:hypothetical protein